MKTIFIFLVLLFAIPLTGQAQNPKAEEALSKTKLEEFSQRTGVVIIRGFEKIGTLRGLYDTSIEVEAKEFTNVGTGNKEFGITVEVKKEGRYDKEHTSYIDYDELESLITGIEYIGKIDNSVTKFSSFQADYNTRGDFQISTFSTSRTHSKIMLAVKSGRIGGVMAYFNLSSLPKIINLIQNAKNRIDSLKKE